MKKKKTFYSLVIMTWCVVFSSCSGDDEVHPPVVLENNVVLRAAVHQSINTHQIEIEGDEQCEYLAEDQYVATVNSSGLIHSALCGNTNVQVKGKGGTSLVNVTVQPVYNTWTLPNYTWLKTTCSDVRSHYSSKYTEEFSSDNGMYEIAVLDYSTQVPIFSFVFENDKLVGYVSLFEETLRYEVELFLAERYARLGELLFIDAFMFEQSSMSIQYYEDSGVDGYDQVVYISTEYLIEKYGNNTRSIPTTEVKLLRETPKKMLRLLDAKSNSM